MQISEIFPFRAYVSIYTSTWIYWYYTYGIVAIFFAFRYHFFLKQLLKDRAIRVMATGLIYIVSASAVGKEIIGSFLVHSGGIEWQGFNYGMITGVAESLELLGLITGINALMIELIRRKWMQRWSLSISK